MPFSALTQQETDSIPNSRQHPRMPRQAVTRTLRGRTICHETNPNIPSMLVTVDSTFSDYHYCSILESQANRCHCRRHRQHTRTLQGAIVSMETRSYASSEPVAGNISITYNLSRIEQQWCPDCHSCHEYREQDEIPQTEARQETSNEHINSALIVNASPYIQSLLGQLNSEQESLGSQEEGGVEENGDHVPTKLLVGDREYEIDWSDASQSQGNTCAGALYHPELVIYIGVA